MVKNMRLFAIILTNVTTVDDVEIRMRGTVNEDRDSSVWADLLKICASRYAKQGHKENLRVWCTAAARNRRLFEDTTIFGSAPCSRNACMTFVCQFCAAISIGCDPQLGTSI